MDATTGEQTIKSNCDASEEKFYPAALGPYLRKTEVILERASERLDVSCEAVDIEDAFKTCVTIDGREGCLPSRKNFGKSQPAAKSPFVP